MKQTVNFSQFCDAFKLMDRNGQFTYEGKRALFDYLENYEEETGEEMELDIVALCCEFSEYENLAELQENYTNITNMEDLENRTTVIKILDSDKFIIQDF